MIYRILFVLSAVWLLVACAEDKLDNIADNRYITEAFKSSNIRIVNFGSSNQVIANGDSLTNFVIRYGEHDPLNGIYPPTKYFPSGGRLGRLWTIPQDVLDHNNKASLQLTYLAYQGMGFDYQFEVQDKGRPVDYYTLPADYFSVGLPDVIEVPRGIESPSRPEYCKVRLINFSERPGETQNQNEQIEEFYGPVTLTWADGTAIDDQFNNLAVGEVSDYVEIPYGTYQLKVLTEDGKQMPAVGSPSMDHMTNSLCWVENRSIVHPTYMTYAPVTHFKPGGIYTVVVYANSFTYPYLNDPDYDGGHIQNGFTIIADTDDPVNSTFARAQFVNARPEAGEVSLKVSSRNTDAVPFGNYTDYIALINGKQAFEAVSDNRVVASLDYDIHAGDNYTVWLYQTAAGKDTLVVSHNNLSGVTSTAGSDTQDATHNRIKVSFYSSLRFFNFNVDFPYATFTSDNGKAFGNEGAAEQLVPGFIPSVEPDVRLFTALGGRSAYQNVTKIVAYRASAASTPGTWADDVPILTTRDLVTRPELYDVRGNLPTIDIGSYSIALVGRQTDDPAYQSRMIIVKHTK